MRRGAGGRARPRGGDTRGRGPPPGRAVPPKVRCFLRHAHHHAQFCKGSANLPSLLAWHRVEKMRTDPTIHTHTLPEPPRASRTALARLSLLALSPRSRRAERPHAARPRARPRAALPALTLRCPPSALLPRRARPGQPPLGSRRAPSRRALAPRRKGRPRAARREGAHAARGRARTLLAPRRAHAARAPSRRVRTLSPRCPPSRRAAGGLGASETSHLAARCCSRRVPRRRAACRRAARHRAARRRAACQPCRRRVHARSVR